MVPPVPAPRINNVFINNSVLFQAQEQPYNKIQKIDDLKPKSSSVNNYETIESIFAQKLADFAQLGYFPQYYEPSLQATYFALYILDAVGLLNQIDQGAVLDYIMSHYNEETQTFMDIYAYRYLDTIFPRMYRPYTSVLEVNCYAILSEPWTFEFL